ncbi:MAG: HAD family hydrolase [Oscillospiraceae bacterium]|nr:HAD family hydrolase [Oscillospiraceae bacterium]
MYTDGVLFDLDGTLWDSCRVVAESWGVTLRRLVPGAVPPGTDDVRGIMGMTAPQIVRALFSQYGEAAKTLALTCMREENAYIAAHGGKLYPGLEETLAALSARVPLFIVSNCQDGYIQCFLESSGLGGCFRDYECEGSTGLDKAENIALLCRRHGLRRPVYVGDTRSDETAARAAGCTFVHAAYGFGTADAPDAVIEALRELPELLTGEGEKHV